MKKRITSILCVVLIIVSATTVVYASGTTLKIDDAICSPGEIVSVPIRISGNSGIAGAVIKILYDDNMELVAVNQGDAFGSLAYTPPAKLTSNPITLLWDGMEADDSNGVIATLQFRTPVDVGTYNISALYDVGGIYDGELQDLDVAIDNGTVTVRKDKAIQVTLTDKINIKLEPEDQIEGKVFVALYSNENILLELEAFMAQKTITTKFENMTAGKYIKVFWWTEKSITPYCEAIRIDL